MTTHEVPITRIVGAMLDAVTPHINQVEERVRAVEVGLNALRDQQTTHASKQEQVQAILRKMGHPLYTNDRKMPPETDQPPALCDKCREYLRAHIPAQFSDWRCTDSRKASQQIVAEIFGPSPVNEDAIGGSE
jgi:hypothetical protein